MPTPIYLLEWRRAARRAQKIPWRWGYVGVLTAELLWLVVGIIDSFFTGDRVRPAEIADSLLRLVALQQAAAILLVTPALAAGSIADEKRRGTFDFLLITPLSSGEIVLGKWLAQATQTLYLISPGYLLLALLAGAFGEEAAALLTILDQVALLYTVAACSLLASACSTTTTRAMIGVYIGFAAALLTEWLLGLRILSPGLWALPLRIELEPRAHVTGFVVMEAVVLAALALAVWRLRPAHERQQSAVTRVLSRWWDRPPILDTPMRWKERFIGDWMSVAGWSALARWQKCLVVAALTAAVLLMRPEWSTFIAVALVQLVLSVLFVGIRAAGSVTSERERQTWDSLLVTNMDARQLLRGKLWGHIDALRPYLLAYLGAAVAAAAVVQPLAIPVLVYAWLASWILLYYLGAIGIASSVAAESTWRSIAMTLVAGVGYVLVSQLVLVVFVGVIISIGLALLFSGGPRIVPIALLALSPLPGLIGLFALAEERLQHAERLLIERDKATSWSAISRSPHLSEEGNYR